jgi:phage shock protein C
MAKRLYRSRNQIMLGGVCGGLAEYFDVDVTIVRLLWVLAFFAGGAGVLAYLVAWIIIPQEPSDLNGEKKTKALDEGESEAGEDRVIQASETRPSGEGGTPRERNRLAGLILILAGVYFFASQFFPGHLFRLTRFWPLLLIFLGLFFLVRGLRHNS